MGPPVDTTPDQTFELSEESFGYQQVEKGNNIAKEQSRRGGGGSRKSTDTEEEWSIASPRNTALNLVASRALSYLEIESGLGRPKLSCINTP